MWTDNDIVSETIKRTISSENEDEPWNGAEVIAVQFNKLNTL